MEVSLIPTLRQKKQPKLISCFAVNYSQLHWASLSVPAMGKIWQHTHFAKNNTWLPQTEHSIT